MSLASKRRSLSSVEEYEKNARSMLSQRLINYIFRAAESETTLRRNIEAFSKYALRRRVLQEVEELDTRTSYFGGRIKSNLPFFPSCINVSPMYPRALLDLLAVSKSYQTPIFISHLAIEPHFEVPKLPLLVPETSPLVWQIYFRKGNLDFCMKQAKLAKSWGYKGIAVTVDAELNVKLGYGIPNDLSSTQFLRVTREIVRRLRESTQLPLVVKGIMAPEDAELAIELGADGIIVSNHGGRILDEGEAALAVLPEIVRHLKSKKRTRSAEVFFDGGIRRGTDILKALALGAKGCLIGRPIFWGLAVDRKKGASDIMRILNEELLRSALLCGVSQITGVSSSILRKAD